MLIAVLGATGKTGRFVVEALCERGYLVRAIGRSPERLARLDARATWIVADIEQPATLAPALAGVDVIASLAHARLTSSLLAAWPASCRRMVLTGSLRRFSKLPDPAAEAVRAGERAFITSGRPGVMLHPAMVYGAPEERNINRVLRFLKRFPAWLPVPVALPDGGRHTLQPIFVDDLVAAVVAAIERPECDGPPIAVAGPEPITYRAMVETCARLLGRRVIVLPVPLAPLVALARLLEWVGVRLPLDAAELARAAEDKAYDVSDLSRRLGVTPRPFVEGLRLKLARGWL